MSTSSNSVDRKTDTRAQNPNGYPIVNRATKRKVKKNIIPNALNNYRNVTYNFTISTVPSEWLKDARYRTEQPKYVILKSGGKGTKDYPLPEQLSLLQSKNVLDPEKFLADNKAKVEGFNKNSPGRFDMFIDDVEIEGITSFGQANGASLATKLGFTVVEPYSINGFVEALHISSLAAGYVNYISANFLLTIDFWGYPDELDVQQSAPIKIKKTTKFILFKLSSVKVDITEQGTRYQCGGTLVSDRIFGNPNKLKKAISAEGSTIKEILEDLCKNVEQQIKESDNESQPGSTKFHDKYEIRFPVVEKGEYKNIEEGNAIGKSKISEFNKDNALNPMPDPSAPQDKKSPTAEEVKRDGVNYKFTTNTNVKVQFNQGKNINECIESVIVDSTYVRGLIKNFKPDENGLVNYFLIVPEVINLSEINPQTKDFYKKYIFNVTEYKVHYTRVPGYQSIKFDIGNISNIIYKEYNYLYTGKNIDVLNFRLDFNNLYFESIPYALGNNNFVGSKNSAVNDQSNKVEYKTESLNKVASNQTPSAPTKVEPVELNPKISGSGGQLTDDPYHILSRNMHDAIVNAKVSGSQGTLEILGDPFFISTTGTGNYKAKIQDGLTNVTEDNEIDPTFGEIYILVNFRNPVDLNQFENKRVPFSGAYRITQLKSTFKSGVFKQELKLIRIPAQIPKEDNTEPTNPNVVAITSPDPNSQIVPDSTPSVSGPGIRPDPSLLSIPTVNNSMYSLVGKTAVNFVSQGVSQLSAASSVYSLAQSRLSEGLRLAESSINTPLQSLATLKSAGQQLGSAVGNQLTSVKNALTTFASDSPLSSIVNSLPNTENLVGGLSTKLLGGAKDQALGSLSKTLGIDINNLSSTAKEKIQGLKSKAEELSVNLPRAISSGVKIDNIPLDKLTNIPLIAPPTVVKPPDIPLQDIQGLDIAKAFGVTDLQKLPGGITPDKINQTIAENSGIAGKLLASKLSIPTDLSAVKDKFNSVKDKVVSAGSQVGQILESSQASLGLVNIASAANLFGSKTAQSPLDKLISPLTQNTPPAG